MFSNISRRLPVTDLNVLPAENERNIDGNTSFASELNKAIQSVNDLQLKAEQNVEALALGEIDDFHSVTIATTKADLALQLTIQIRNRVVEAYQEISRMQV